MRIIVGLWVIVSTCTSVFAQTDPKNFKDAVTSLAQTVAKEYTSPMVSGFGASMNAGWFKGAPKPVKFGLHLEGGIVAMGSLFEKNQESFVAHDMLTLDQAQAADLTSVIFSDPAFNGLSQNQKDAIQQEMINQLLQQPVAVTVSGATVIGSKKEHITVVYGGSSVSYTHPVNGTQTYDLAGSGGETVLSAHGLGIPVVGLAAIQLTAGTVYGTNLTLRYLPKTKFGNTIGSVEYIGYGLQHNPAVWMSWKPPVNFAVSWYTQKVQQGKFFESTASAIGLSVSKQLGPRIINIEPYAGIMRESTSMHFKYDYVLSDGTIEPLSFNVTGSSSWRYTLGLSLRLLVAKLNADYNFAKYSGFSAGLTFAL